MSEMLYLQTERNIKITSPVVTLGDVAQLSCSDGAVLARNQVRRVAHLPDDGYGRYVCSASTLVRLHPRPPRHGGRGARRCHPHRRAEFYFNVRGSASEKHLDQLVQNDSGRHPYVYRNCVFHYDLPHRHRRPRAVFGCLHPFSPADDARIFGAGNFIFHRHRPWRRALFQPFRTAEIHAGPDAARGGNAGLRG